MKLSSNAPASWRSGLLVGILLILACGVSAQTPTKRSALGIHLRIETDRLACRVGDSIPVRITLRNVSAERIRVIARPPTMLARLHVYDSIGREVQPVYQRDLRQGSGSTHAVSLEAGNEMTARWWGGIEWGNLRSWGYDIQTPGKYTIVGPPGVVGPEVTPDVETMRSSRAEFTIRS